MSFDTHARTCARWFGSFLLEVKIIGLFRNLNVVVTAFLTFSPSENIGLGRKCFNHSPLFCVWAPVQKRAILSVSWWAANFQAGSSEAVSPSECTFVLKTASLIQNTVRFHENVLVSLVGTHMEADETYDLFFYKHSGSHLSIRSLSYSDFSARRPYITQMEFHHDFFLFESTRFVETNRGGEEPSAVLRPLVTPDPPLPVVSEAPGQREKRRGRK